MLRLLRVLGAAAILSMCAWAIVVLVVEPYRCNIARQRTKNSLEIWYSARREYRTTLDAREELARVRICLERRPSGLIEHMQLAALLELLDRPEEAILAYRETLRYHDRPEIYAEISRLLLEGGNREEAVEALTTAARFDPKILVTHDEKGYHAPRDGIEIEIWNRLLAEGSIPRAALRRLN